MRMAIRSRPGLALGLVAYLLGADAASLHQLTSAWPNTDFSRRTVELREVDSGGVPKDGNDPVINDDVSGEPIVVVATAQMRSPLDRSRISESRRIPAAAAFHRSAQGRVLDFTWRNDTLVDEQTGSEWDIFGRAVRGPLAGTTLTPAEGGVHFAFAWLAFNPQTQIR